jgi:hypothetical protein
MPTESMCSQFAVLRDQTVPTVQGRCLAPRQLEQLETRTTANLLQLASTVRTQRSATSPNFFLGHRHSERVDRRPARQLPQEIRSHPGNCLKSGLNVLEPSKVRNSIALSRSRRLSRTAPTPVHFRGCPSRRESQRSDSRATRLRQESDMPRAQRRTSRRRQPHIPRASAPTFETGAAG